MSNRLTRFFRRRPTPPHCGDVGAHQGPFRYKRAGYGDLLRRRCQRCGCTMFPCTNPTWPERDAREEGQQ